MNQAQERRIFWRAPFNAQALLNDATCVWPAQLKDISLKGALLEMNQAWHGEHGVKCQLKLELQPGAIITMRGVVAHLQGHQLGIRCDEIDLDSITHLRRLVELNAGDPELLERELAALLHTAQAEAAPTK